jgi:hypothetical protein
MSRRRGRVTAPRAMKRRVGKPPFASLVSARTAALLAYVGWWLTPVGVLGYPWPISIARLVTVGASVWLGRLAFRAAPGGVWWRLLGATCALTAGETFVDLWSLLASAESLPLFAILCAIRCCWAVGYAGILVLLVRKHLGDSAMDSGDRALARAMSWVAVPAGLLSFLLHLIYHPSGWEWQPYNLAYLFVPVTVALVALVRGRLRSRWLAGVRKGRDPLWRIADAGALAPAALPGVDLAVEAARGRDVLLRVRVPEDPYRDVETAVPVAVLRPAVTSDA